MLNLANVRLIVLFYVLAIWAPALSAQIKNPGWDLCEKVAASFEHSSPTQEVMDWLIEYSVNKNFKSSMSCPDIPFAWSEKKAAEFKTNAEMAAIRANPQTPCEREWVAMIEKRAGQQARGEQTSIYEWDWLNKAEDAIRYNMSCPDFEQTRAAYIEKEKKWEREEAARQAEARRQAAARTAQPERLSPDRLLRLCHSGVGEACVEYGLSTRQSVPKGQRGEIYKLYEKGCGFDDGGRACILAGLGYEMGQELPQDFAKAKTYLRRGCYQLGVADGCMFLALFYTEREKNNYEALQANKMACRLGKQVVCDALAAQGLSVTPLD